MHPHYLVITKSQINGSTIHMTSWMGPSMEWFFSICLILHHPLGTVSHMESPPKISLRIWRYPSRAEYCLGSEEALYILRVAILMKYSLHYHHLASCRRYWHCGKRKNNLHFATTKAILPLLYNHAIPFNPNLLSLLITLLFDFSF